MHALMRKGVICTGFVDLLVRGQNLIVTAFVTHRRYIGYHRR